MHDGFWRSVNLTGNQTAEGLVYPDWQFWRSVNLTGNQTARVAAWERSGRHTCREEKP